MSGIGILIGSVSEITIYASSGGNWKTRTWNGFSRHAANPTANTRPSVLPGTGLDPLYQRAKPVAAQHRPRTSGPKMNQTSRFAHSANSGGNHHKQRAQAGFDSAFTSENTPARSSTYSVIDR